MKHIADLRKEVGLTQAELAFHLNISQQAVSKYEKEEREPDIDVLIRIADFFNVTTDYLLGLSAPTEIPKPEKDIFHFEADEKRLIEIYRSLNEDSRIMALSKLLELSREEALVAAREERYLDSMGKSLPSNGTEGGKRVG